MSIIESDPLYARFYMAQIIADHLQSEADSNLDRITAQYQHDVPRHLQSGITPRQLQPEINKLMTARSRSSTLKQYLNRTLRKVSLDPDKNLYAPLSFSSLDMPDCDISPLGVTDQRFLLPVIHEGSNQALTDFLNALSTNQPPLLKFSREQIVRYLLDPSSAGQLVKSIPIPTRLPYFYIQYIFPNAEITPIVIANIQAILV